MAKTVAPAPRADLVDKEPKSLHTNFAQYIAEQTGYEPDEKTVQLAVILRMDFQRSELNQKDLAARREAAEAKIAEREQRAIEREQAKLNKEKAASEKATKAPAKAPAKKMPAKAPAKTVAKTPAKKAPAKKPSLRVVSKETAAF